MCFCEFGETFLARVVRSRAFEIGWIWLRLAVYDFKLSTYMIYIWFGRDWMGAYSGTLHSVSFGASVAFRSV